MPPELQGPYVPGIIAFLSGSYLVASSTRDLVDGIRSHGWPTVPGRIVAHGVSVGVSRYRVDDSYEVAYRYTVDGVEYEGRRFDYAGRNSFASPSRLASGLATGSRVRVHYDPRHPDRAVLEPGVGPWTLGPIMLGAVLMLGGGALAHEAIAILLSR